MNVIVDGLMTSYQKTGKGKTLLLLHGWGDSSSSFLKLDDRLKDNYQILALDLPGMGGTQGPPTAWGLEGYSLFVKKWLKKIGISNVHAIIGHSNGGAIAIHASANKILQPEKLILIASSGIRTDKKIKRFALKTVSKSGKLLTAPLPSTVKRRTQDKFYKSIGSEVGLFPELEGTFRKIVSDVQSDAKRIKEPVLLIYGTQDHTTPPKYGRIFNSLINGSRLELIDGGHFLHQEQTEQVARMIKDFLES